MAHQTYDYDKTDRIPLDQLPWPQSPADMPYPVRAAQFATIALAAFGLFLSIFGSTAGNPEAVGALVFGFLPTCIAAAACLRFAQRGRIAHTTVIICGAIEILFGLAGMLNHTPPGLLGLLCGLTTSATLTRPSARAWFA
ncbi:hypothetical protein [Nocardia pseudobrasiliensis]|uniref:Uncharacterized protein n=1 Tax=Nocardia pseudobrasiliensis TaxID=45979 RepID=A0A370HXL9_9NOCA|nr:hypothetical protein [Nocardia pseudobrasiliensis]RDI63235.1 hypothetical protein DFR76_111254 [Nocardia pseudobrasiliensis]